MLSLCDTGSQECYTCDHSSTTKVQEHPYRGVSVVLLCFAINQPNSFYNIQRKWSQEVKLICSNVPTILVGTKKVKTFNLKYRIT